MCYSGGESIAWRVSIVVHKSVVKHRPQYRLSNEKQLESVEYLNRLGSVITSDARCTREIKSWTAMTKASFNRKKILFTSKLDFYLRKKLVKLYIQGTAFCNSETWTLRKVDQKYLGKFWNMVLEKNGED